MRLIERIVTHETGYEATRKSQKENNLTLQENLARMEAQTTDDEDKRGIYLAVADRLQDISEDLTPEEIHETYKKPEAVHELMNDLEKGYLTVQEQTQNPENYAEGLGLSDTIREPPIF